MTKYYVIAEDPCPACGGARCLKGGECFSRVCMECAATGVVRREIPLAEAILAVRKQGADADDKPAFLGGPERS